MTLRFLLPPAVGAARARARGELIQHALGVALGEDVEVQVASDYGELDRRAVAGDAELVWAPAMVCIELESTAHAIFKAVRAGRSTYRSAIVARRESELEVAGLAGHRAAWVDPMSLGGFLLAAELLGAQGVSLEESLAEQVFYGSHPAALGAVLEGWADITAVSVGGESEDDVAQALGLHAGPIGPERLAAIAVTGAVPADALALTAALSADHAQGLVDRLFSVPDGGRGPSSLCLAMEAEGFERATPGEYAPLTRFTELAAWTLAAYASNT